MAVAEFGGHLQRTGDDRAHPARKDCLGIQRTDVPAAVQGVHSRSHSKIRGQGRVAAKSDFFGE